MVNEEKQSSIGTLVIVAIIGVAVAYGSGWVKPQPSPYMTPTRPDVVRKVRVLYFTAADCVPCRRFKADVLTDPEVTDVLRSFAYAEYDTATAHGEAAAYKVDGTPTVVAIDGYGAELGRVVGYRPKGEFLAWLSRLKSN